MRASSLVLFLMITFAVAPGPTGCATTRTMPYLSSYGSPKLYSGTRLDYYAITGNTEGLGQFKEKAPAHPLIDFPFSTILDTLILPTVLPVAAYEFIFE